MVLISRTRTVINLCIAGSALAGLASLALLVMKLAGVVKADWLGVGVWIVLLAAIALGALCVAHDISAAC